MLKRLAKQPWFLPVIVALAAFCLQSATVGRFSVWHDEGYSAMLKEYSYSEMLHRTAFDVHPPLYYIALKLWASVVGNSIVGLRMLSVICMSAAVGLSVALTRRFWGRDAARWASVPLLLAPVLVRYGQEMRMYGLVTLFVVAASWLFLALIKDYKRLGSQKRWQLLLGYGVLLSAVFYTHYFATLIVLAHASLLVVLSASKAGSKRPTKVWRVFWREYRWFVAVVALMALLCLPWLPTMLDQVRSVKNGFWIPEFTINSIFSTLASFLFFRSEWITWQLHDGYAVLVAICAVVVWRRSKLLIAGSSLTKLQRYSLPVFVIAPILGLAAISMALTSFYYDRYFTPFAPFFYIGLGVSMMLYYRQVGKSLAFYATASFLLGCLLYGQVLVAVTGNNYGHPRNDYFEMNQLYTTLRTLRQPGELVVSDQVWHYFDLRAYALQDHAQLPLLYAPNKLSEYGNTSLLYDRKDILVTDYDNITSHSFWIVAAKDADVQSIVGDSWIATANHYVYGYGSLTLVVRK